ncbi:MAG: hypothetical protein GC204_14645 [Chloroflexi bacterium]|nr:hypothetical protein [Chloroflexota bacterium]
MIRRAVQALTLTAMSVCIVAGYLGLRAVLWRQDYQIAAMIQSGIIVSVVVGGALGIAYVLLGSLLWRMLGIDWLSLQFGAVVGAVIYGGYNALAPLTIYSVNEEPVWRALQGGVDGLVIGVIVGAVVMIVSGRRLYLDRAGLTRYLILYVTVILLAWLILLVEGVVHISPAAGLIVAVPLVFVLRLAVVWLDRRVDQRYGYDES